MFESLSRSKLHKGSLFSSTPDSDQIMNATIMCCAAIQAYLGRKFGLMPDNMEDAAHVESLLNIAADAVAVSC
jgi:hypothetical protein